MRNCGQCGAELNEYSLFCGSCGAKASDGGTGVGTVAAKSGSGIVRYCEKCGAKLPEGCDYCLICGIKAGEAPPPGTETEVPAASGDVKTPGISARGYSRAMLLFCTATFILLSVAALGLWFSDALPHLTSGEFVANRGAIMYLTSDNILKLKTPLMETPREFVTDYYTSAHISGDKLAKMSQNGRYIAYLNEYSPPGETVLGQLYLRDFGEKRPVDAAPAADRLIAENVTETFFFAQNGSWLVYLSGDSLLVATDFTGYRVIDYGVAGIMDHSDSHILYSKATETGDELYIASISGGAKMIDVNVTELVDYTPSLDKIVYLRNGQDSGRDMIAYDLKQNKQQTLAIGIDAVIAADAATSTALYQTASENPLRYEDLINDSLERDDETIDEPDMADYPLLQEFNEKFGVDEDYNGAMNYEEIVAESARFQSDIDDYEGKRDRDRVRAEVRSTVSVFTDEFPRLYDLHLTSGGSITKLASGSYLPYTGAGLYAGKGFAVWTSAGWKGFEKVQITHYPKDFSSATLLSYLHECISETLYIQQFGYAPATVHIGEGRFYSSGWQLTDKSDGIYFAMGEGNPADPPANNGALYYASLQNGTVGGIVQVDENVAGVGPMLSQNRLLYYKDKFGDICDLYMITGVSGEKIGDNISLSDEYFKVVNDGKTLLYCEHFSSGSESGNMFLMADQTRQLATGVYRVFYRSDSLAYFLRSVRDGRAELYAFSSDGLELVDENVIAVME